MGFKGFPETVILHVFFYRGHSDPLKTMLFQWGLKVYGSRHSPTYCVVFFYRSKTHVFPMGFKGFPGTVILYGFFLLGPL